ncbi:hypothetical protein, partial [Escherichia coli]|uniref:hypothetical protein n=1 Tax=Escherichia coli TaxID=562 RepID=UPI0019530C90
GVRVEAMLHRREAPDLWRAFARPGKRIAPGDVLRFGAATEGAPDNLSATVTEKGEGGEIALRFDLSGPALDAATAS